MNNRSNALAQRIERGAEALITLAEGLSAEQWRTVVPNDQREVGVLFHHVASLYPLEIDLAKTLASGNPITGVDWGAIDEMNAKHVHDHPLPTQQETVQLLRDNSQAAAKRVRAFTDADLDNAATVSLYGDAPLTAQYFIEDHALRHSFHHLANIQTAFGL